MTATLLTHAPWITHHDEVDGMTLTAQDIDRYAQQYRMGHAGKETLGEFIARMKGQEP